MSISIQTSWPIYRSIITASYFHCTVAHLEEFVLANKRVIFRCYKSSELATKCILDLEDLSTVVKGLSGPVPLDSFGCKKLLCLNNPAFGTSPEAIISVFHQGLILVELYAFTFCIDIYDVNIAFD